MKLAFCTAMAVFFNSLFGGCLGKSSDLPDEQKCETCCCIRRYRGEDDEVGDDDEIGSKDEEKEEKRALVDKKSYRNLPEATDAPIDLEDEKKSKETECGSTDTLCVGFVSKELDIEKARTFLELIQDFKDLIVRSTKIFEDQPGIIEIHGPTMAVGDLHGDSETLQVIIDILSPQLEDGRLAHVVFLGDILDRGPSSSETLMELLKFLNRYPDQIHIIRGNHETMAMYKGFPGKFAARKERLFRAIYEKNLSKFFDSLPYAAIINDNVLAVHGGVPHRDFWEDFWKGEKISEKDIEKFELIESVLWSDYEPYACAMMPNTERGFAWDSKVVCYGEDAAKEFLYPRSIKYMIRAHQPVLGTFFQSPDKTVTTIHTAIYGQPTSIRKQGGVLARLDGSGAPVRTYIIKPY